MASNSARSPLRLLRKWFFCSHLGDVHDVKLYCCCLVLVRESSSVHEERRAALSLGVVPLLGDFRDRVRPVRSFAWLLLGPLNLWARGVRVISSPGHILCSERVEQYRRHRLIVELSDEPRILVLDYHICSIIDTTDR